MKQYKKKNHIALLLISISVLLMAFAFAIPKSISTGFLSIPYVSSASAEPPPWAPAHGYRAKHHYYYYPASHVYYDTDRKLYFYLEGENWRFGASLPAGIHVDVGDHVTLGMDTDKPYEFHSDVVKEYPAIKEQEASQERDSEKGKTKKKDKAKSKKK